MGALAAALEAQRLAMERYKAEGRKTIIGRWCSTCKALISVNDWREHNWTIHKKSLGE